MREYRISIRFHLGRHSCRPFLLEDRSSWRQGRNNRPGKTMSEARGELRNLINLLLRVERVRAVEKLADHLTGCTNAAPCLSGACPCCNLALQRMMVAVGRPLVRRTRSELAMVTVINTHRGARPGELRGRDLYVDFRRRLEAILNSLGISALGGFELSLNTAEDDRYEPFWAEQCHFFCSLAHAERLRNALKDAFKKTAAVARPVRIEWFDCASRGLAYAYKNRTQRRIALIRESERGRSTRWKPLPSAARVEVALAQHDAGLNANVLAVGFRLLTRDMRVLLVRQR